jgi:hypothetical protein
MHWLRQSTTVTVKIGPFLDKGDGVTEETGLSPTVKLAKNGGTIADRNSATAITHDALGWYAVELNTTDTGTLGRLTVLVHAAATHLPVWEHFMILPAAVYDSLVLGTDLLPVDAVDLLTLADGIETSYTLKQALRLILAACAGKSDGADLGTVHYKAPDGSTNRITAGTDTFGNRLSITLNP